MPETDRETKQIFERLRSDVAPTVDVESHRASFDSRRTKRSAHRARAIGAAAVIAALLVTALGLWRSRASEVVVSNSPVSSVPSGKGVPACGTGLGVAVFFTPSATPEQIAAIRARFDASADVDSVDLRDAEHSYTEFLQLFADQPDLISSIQPDGLPSSMKVRLRGGSDATPWLKLQSDPGVLRVAVTRGNCAVDPADGSPKLWGFPIRSDEQVIGAAGVDPNWLITRTGAATITVHLRQPGGALSATSWSTEPGHILSRSLPDGSLIVGGIAPPQTRDLKLFVNDEEANASLTELGVNGGYLDVALIAPSAGTTTQPVPVRLTGTLPDGSLVDIRGTTGAAEPGPGG